MVAAGVVDIVMMLLSAVFSAGVPSVLMMIVITGAIPVLAIATVSAIETGARRRRGWTGQHPASWAPARRRRRRAGASVDTHPAG